MSLFELILLLVLIAISASFTIKFSHEWLQKQRDQQEWREFQTLIYQIQGNALSKHANKVFCLSLNGKECHSQGNHLIELDASGKVRSDHLFSRLMIFWHGFPPGDVLSFSAVGMPRVNGRISACYLRNRQIVNRTIVISMTGQVRESHDETTQKNC